MNGSAKNYLDMDYSGTVGGATGQGTKPPSHNYQYQSSQQRHSQEYSTGINNEASITKTSPRINEIRSIPQVGSRYQVADDDEDEDEEEEEDHSVNKYQTGKNAAAAAPPSQYEASRKPRHIREMEQASGGGVHQPSPARQQQANPPSTYQPSPSALSQPSPNRMYPSTQPLVHSQAPLPFPTMQQHQQQPPLNQYSNPPPLKTLDSSAAYGTGNSLSSSMSSSMRKENHRYDSYDMNAKMLESPQYASSPAPSASIPMVPVRSPPRAHQHFAVGGKGNIHYEEEDYGLSEPQQHDNDEGEDDDDGDEGEEGEEQQGPTTAAQFMQQYRAIGTNQNNPALMAAAMAAHEGQTTKPKKKKKVKKKTSAGGARKQPPPPVGSAAAIQAMAIANVKKRMAQVNVIGR